MVLIFNPEENYTTYKLYDLLIEHKIEFKVIDPTQIFDFTIEEECSGIKINLNGIKIHIDRISCVFSTSSNLNLCIDYVDDKVFSRDSVLLHMNSEWRNVNEFIAYILNSLPNLSIPYDSENKFVTNALAQKVGFKVPASITSTRKSDIYNFFKQKQEDKFFVKRINNFLSGTLLDGTYFQHEGCTLNISDLHQFKDSLIPCQTQINIDIKYEVRCVFVDGSIFSVINDASGVGMPYKVDSKTKNRIIILMKKLNLKFGSIDLIIDSCGNSFFLEVNPHGQFDLIEVLGDYKVYNKIFEYLYEKEKSTL